MSEEEDGFVQAGQTQERSHRPRRRRPRYTSSSSDINPRKRQLNDWDVLRREHRFLREEGNERDGDRWSERVALRYYRKLYKEYALVDCSTSKKEGTIGLRWRTKQEVVVGKGQFVCGDIRCNEVDRLRSFELDFSYVENRKRKRALVKVRLCPTCHDRCTKSSRHESVRRKRKRRRRTSLVEKDEEKKNVFEGTKSPSRSIMKAKKKKKSKRRKHSKSTTTKTTTTTT